MRTNIILIGPPGCGKSTVGKILAGKCAMGFLDIDTYLEEQSNNTVGDILNKFGDEAFLDFEAEQTLKIDVENHVIATTGSSPLRPEALRHLHQNGLIIYLDTPVEIIITRLQEIKVERIVGMKTRTLPEILVWRKKNFYDSYPSDVSLQIEKQEKPEALADKILDRIKTIKYRSTRSETSNYSFSEALLKGIAPDGGLFVPTHLPRLTPDLIAILIPKNYAARVAILFQLFGTDFTLAKITVISQAAYGENFDHPEIAPVKYLKDNQYLLELWHGPTAAFKDLALQFKPLCFVESIQIANQKRAQAGLPTLAYLILTATSGDTGKAALAGYRDQAQVKIMVFYPRDGVSEIQKKQMITQQGENVIVYGIEGNFDDAQTAVKHIFNDTEFNRKLAAQNIYLSSANSINWGRIMPQIFYYVSAYCDLVKKGVIQNGEQIDIAVPTGNFGNILAAYYARKMGLPLGRLICASNANDVLTEFIQTGLYDLTKRKPVKTPSPSMDILVSSNLERLLYELTKKPAQVKKWMEALKTKQKFKIDDQTKQRLQAIFSAGTVSNDETLQTIKTVFDQIGVLIDPHTAVAQHLVETRCCASLQTRPILIVSTAHWAKFGSDVYRALNGLSADTPLKGKNEFKLLQEIQGLTGKPLPDGLLDLQKAPIRYPQICSKDLATIKKIVWDFAVK